MKHQYFGDVNDYVKFGLLRVLGEVSGLRVGVAWMLTPDDDRPDGSRTAYWRDPAWRAHDPHLFDCLARLATQPTARNVELFRRWSLVPNALDYDAVLPDDADGRVAWMAAARECLAPCPLLFFDPDNGLEVESVPFGRRGSSKYLYWREAAAAWDAGHSLLVYQHFARQEREPFAAALESRAREVLAGARVETLRTAHALFLLAVRPEHADALAPAPEEAARRWPGRITLADPGDHSGGDGDRPAGAENRAADVAAACEALSSGGPGAAAAALAGRYPFAATPARRRAYSELDALHVWVGDGFIDRYDGARLVFPGTLRLLSALLPGEFPYHPNWKVSETHPAYWDLYPTLDHVVPVARGGLDEPSNWVTTSQRNNSAKAHWTIPELGWSLRPAGTMAGWDGLTGWFRGTLAAQPAYREHDAIRHWATLLERVLAER